MINKTDRQGKKFIKFNIYLELIKHIDVIKVNI